MSLFSLLYVLLRRNKCNHKSDSLSVLGGDIDREWTCTGTAGPVRLERKLISKIFPIDCLSAMWTFRHFALAPNAPAKLRALRIYSRRAVSFRLLLGISPLHIRIIDIPFFSIIGNESNCRWDLVVGVNSLKAQIIPLAVQHLCRWEPRQIVRRNHHGGCFYSFYQYWILDGRS